MKEYQLHCPQLTQLVIGLSLLQGVHWQICVS